MGCHEPAMGQTRPNGPYVRESLLVSAPSSSAMVQNSSAGLNVVPSLRNTPALKELPPPLMMDTASETCPITSESSSTAFLGCCECWSRQERAETVREP